MKPNLPLLLDAQTGTGAATGVTLPAGQVTFQGVVVGTGAVTATVLVQVSNNDTDWLTMGTLTLSGTTRASDGFASNAPWKFVRGNVSARTGTGAAVTLTMGA